MEDPHPLDVLSVTTTVGSLADAQSLAHDLVARRLAACVQLEPGLQAVYR
ncbi:MAG: divalent cation tolerance protein CutA, partial [Comamonadaceae bacterium]